MGRWLSKFQTASQTAIVGAELEAEPRRQAEAIEITRLMQTEGWAMVWSETLKETIAFANDEGAGAGVPAGIAVYSRAELEQIMGKGHSPDMLKLMHEGKKHGAKVKNQKRGTP